MQSNPIWINIVWVGSNDSAFHKSKECVTNVFYNTIIRVVDYNWIWITVKFVLWKILWQRYFEKHHVYKYILKNIRYAMHGYCVSGSGFAFFKG